MFESQVPILLVIVPLIGAFLVSFVGLYKPRLSYGVVLAALGSVVVLSILLLRRVVMHGPVEYYLGGWKPPIGIAFYVDQLNAVVLVIITLVGFLNAIQSYPVVKKEISEHFAPFYSLYLLLITGLIGMTITGDAFNLYVMVEIVAISNYCLIGFRGRRASLATFNYIVVGSIGAGFYLLGVGYLYIKTGTLNMADIKATLSTLHGSTTVYMAFVMMVTGLMMKMALFPFHGWLPNAYTYALHPVSSLVAPLTTKVSVYVLLRVMYWIFGSAYVLEMIDWNTIVVTLATVAIVAGGLLALAQENLKRMLTYVIVAEVGYMVGGVWLVNSSGFIGATYHIINDAAVTLCAFMVVAAIAYKLGDTSLKNMRGLFGKMPVTMAVLVVCALTLIGVPPTSGFVSKWYLISGAIEANQWHLMIALLFASFVNVVLFFRVFEIAYFEEPAAESAQGIDEAPAVMLVPMVLVAASLVVLGINAQSIIGTLIVPVMPF